MRLVAPALLIHCLAVHDQGLFLCCCRHCLLFSSMLTSLSVGHFLFSSLNLKSSLALWPACLSPLPADTPFSPASQRAACCKRRRSTKASVTATLSPSSPSSSSPASRSTPLVFGLLHVYPAPSPSPASCLLDCHCLSLPAAFNPSNWSRSLPVIAETKRTLTD